MENKDINLEEIIGEGKGIKCKVCGRVLTLKERKDIRR